ncbi:murein DD-endopeptidase MepM/ murein hydrolase activator NlpD [Pseudoclavibacter sp. JAI123]|uniref:M23 family metallopeptidase n=1 Tax=Pseudoclavibacter sp. JAI123 TaxID=2723065 RepID=UPI0015CA7829|nr:M23 family metallopeptidase [Pseudoclavibacter sp. JAI123]NYF14770.1 murein DD-endopeptidase MepM/ murein hydrolase activator NlpD [Pseudoclavibacter sp. JAI123]
MNGITAGNARVFAAAVAVAGLLALSACSASPALTIGADAPPSVSETAPVETGPGVIGEQFTPVVVSALADPIPVLGTDERIHLAYELQLTNGSPSKVKITGVEASASGTALQELEGDDLDDVMRVAGTTDGGGLELGPGQNATVWMDATVASDADVPDRIEHTVTVEMPKAQPPLYEKTIQQTTQAVSVDKRDLAVIGPPLTGDNWLDANGCCGLTAHRGAVSPINGTYWAPERWAIDYVKLTPTMKLSDDGARDNARSYPGYGQNVIAVADGPIVAITTDRPEQEPGTAPGPTLTLDEYGGNYVVQDIGGGTYAFYAHLKTGNPFDLQVGQQLTRGDRLGLLGNTGNTDAPHLHFHLMDSPNPLASNGLPFVFDTFTLDGQVTSQAALDAGEQGKAYKVDEANAGDRSGQVPLTGDLMTYPGG